MLTRIGAERHGVSWNDDVFSFPLGCQVEVEFRCFEDPEHGLVCVPGVMRDIEVSISGQELHKCRAGSGAKDMASLAQTKVAGQGLEIHKGNGRF